jgi:hypothetical protein
MRTIGISEINCKIFFGTDNIFLESNKQGINATLNMA